MGGGGQAQRPADPLGSAPLGGRERGGGPARRAARGHARLHREGGPVGEDAPAADGGGRAGVPGAGGGGRLARAGRAHASAARAAGGAGGRRAAQGGRAGAGAGGYPASAGRNGPSPGG